MTISRPPRLAVALLDRFVPDNEPLAGDLLEEFQVRQSSRWFWWQVLMAILTASRQRSREIRPLRLVDDPSASGLVDARLSRHGDRQRAINLTASPVHGVGGLGLVALGVLVTLVRPEIWWVVLGAILGGIVLGIVRILLSRRRARSSAGSG